MKITNRKFPKNAFFAGSALILTVVLTSLLAIVGVMFVMASQVDKIATSSISENKELNLAVDAIIERISQELILDVPGVPGQEYYDYPDASNAWLASLEPVLVGPDRYDWLHISDVYGTLTDRLGGVPAVGIDVVIPDYQEPGEIGDSNLFAFYRADADGDGVLDSLWTKLDDITSSKGRPIYAVIRVIDNGGMLNVNTIFANIGGDDERKGDMLTDIYIDGLVKSSPTETIAIANFLGNRSNAPDASTYHREAARRIENPDTATGHFYTFYDISEELSLRNRFILHPNQTITRLEAGSAEDPDRCLSTTLRATVYGNAYTPYTSLDFDAWKRRFNPFDVGEFGSEPQTNNYDFRHLLTTYNMDRIIDPCGFKMANINDAPLPAIYWSIRSAFADANWPDPNGSAAQMAVNIVDYRDDNNDVRRILVDGDTYYGFERPCVYISEMAHKFTLDPNDPNTVYRSYGIELYKPYFEDNDPLGWQLVIDGNSVGIEWSGTRRFHVIRWQDPNVASSVLGVSFFDPNEPADPNLFGYNPGDYSSLPQDIKIGPNTIFAGGSVIKLERFVAETGEYVTVDSVTVPDAGVASRWLIADGSAHSFQRDITRHKCIRRLWDLSLSDVNSPTLGQHNRYVDLDPSMIQAHPANKNFTNIGEIGMVFRNSAYSVPIGAIEADVRINLGDPGFQQIFKYLTVFDPSTDGINNDGDFVFVDPNWMNLVDESNFNETPEWKVPGRININTAPWYVIAQLPWMTPKIAQAIVAYRDKMALFDSMGELVADYTNRTIATGSSKALREDLGFESIGELTTVINNSGNPLHDEYSMHYYGSRVRVGDEPEFPDLTPGDDAPDDFEEQDLIFSRISNLVTVRSDVFTAYILVRIGTDGPQKRVIAILDRSNVYSGNGKVRVIALHPVPDPR